jgi:hypothetical protein
VTREEKLPETAVRRSQLLALMHRFIGRERSFPNRFAKISFGSGCDKNSRDGCSPFSGVFENQDAAIIEGDFLGAPRRALIDAVWVGIEGIPGTVEPVDVKFVVGDSLLDRLPGWLDGLHGVDVEGRRRWAWKLDDAFP